MVRPIHRPDWSGAIIGAGNNFVTQGFGSTGSWNWDNIHYDQVLMSGLMGAGMSYIGGQVSGLISPYVSDLTSGLGGQALQQMASQGLTGAATGFVLGTGSALLSGACFGDTLKVGGQGALMGFAVGTVSGMASGMRSAYKANENPWTGKTNSNNADFFEGTKYSDKVLNQMNNDDFHSFPEGVKTFQKDGYITTIQGGDGIIRTQLNIPGSYKGYNGEFQFMKEPNGLIRHRYFQKY